MLLFFNWRGNLCLERLAMEPLPIATGEGSSADNNWRGKLCR